MNRKYLYLALLFAPLLLDGCATCREHPTACAIGSAVIVGSVAATIAAHSDSHGHQTPPHLSNTLPVNCGNGSTCQ